MTTTNTDRQLLEKLAESSLREQRARRRWGVFFKLLFCVYLVTVTGLYYFGGSGEEFAYDEPHAAVVDINGVIVAGGDNDSERINGALRQAFGNDAVKGVVLRINSPGGSPVESNRIFQEVRRLRKEYPNKKVYAVAGDFCASGGYYIAASADEIYVDKNTLLGSIGVILAGFGFVEAMEKLGVERRVQTAGRSKNMLDPFLPTDPEDEAKISQILQVVHDNFIAAVREGRGERLSAQPDIFSGAIFVGERGVELGLADGVGDMGYVVREIIGVEEVVYYNGEKDFWEVVIEQLGVQIAASWAVAPMLR